MKKVVYLLIAVIAIAVSACSQSATVDKIVEKPADEITAEDVKVMVDYLENLIGTADVAVKACQTGGPGELKKWAEEHKADLEMAEKVFTKLDEIPSSMLDGTNARDVSGKFVGLVMVLHMIGAR